ncbi:hypothetical protein NEUTE1DRAFT_110118 [Neurospora tetrasperma FGSC 2508]|uniref:Uncharacterized protein n=1 Tax=Neurospora tetrasperma (strain FGSC 2508 / ATCC MYA-4615 / P0657) TaxID=510951 RepID=F8MMS5_NEUT8|nr:uncharacterized protein NEUTE1DRAFT_110118 [Neurospora tetrasperma FGSC 2508]EGO57949.1 hypothetical protein NEUTE1DRAFT_110118 [Neurospora tetrasperma FGSC 2508]EGZ71756.1 hypothetical protein NEUTE2DRAFT_138899 [Neurospora tetrasperma FGSC 2509]
MRPRLLSTSLLDSSGQITHVRFTQGPESLGQLAILALECLDHLRNTHSKSYKSTYPRHYHKQIHQNLDTNTLIPSRYLSGSSNRRRTYGRNAAVDGYDDGSQDRQISRSICSRPFRSSRRPPCLERQDAFVDTRTRKDRQIQIRNLVNDGGTCPVRHQFKGAHTHGLVIINGIVVLQEEAMLPRWLDVGATQPLGKRRRGLIPEDFADECEVKKKKRSGVRNRGNPEQSSDLGSACDAAENSN